MIGKLKILHITDTHLKLNHNFDPTIRLVERACETEKPDIVMITGDNVVNYENAENTKKTINALMNIFDSRNIPVAVTFDDGEKLSGCGTYNIPVLSSDGEKIKFNLTAQKYNWLL